MIRHASALAVAAVVIGPLMLLTGLATDFVPTCSTTVDLDPQGRWEGEVDSLGVCLRLGLERGQFARVTLEGAQLGGMLQAMVFGPGDSIPLLRTAGGQALSWEAQLTGVHVIVLSAARRVRGVGVTVIEVEDGEALAERRRALASDPRLVSLAARAIPIRTLQPADTEFSDLGPLAPLLADVRVVLLGEADHGDGSDFLAKARLIRFLHAELGFDVLAFEGGVYDMWRAWRDISAGRDPMTAFVQGPNWRWAQARQLEPLVRYIAEAADGPRPLVLAGIDVQRSGRTASSDTLLAELATFLRANGLGGPFADAQSAEGQLLKRLNDYQYRPVPDSAALAAFESAVSATAARIDRSVATEDGRYWARILWNVAARAAWVWPEWPGARRPFCPTDACRDWADRDPEMAQNVLWLANRMYPDRRIIVWAHNAHIGRNLPTESMPSVPYMMGDAVRSELGDRSYSVAFVSHEGSYRLAHPQAPTFDIVPDQDPEPEFEELMAAVGHSVAIVALRGAVAEHAWLAQPFLARPIAHSTSRSRWGSSYDAFFFIRTQDPVTAIPWQ